jgi:hypothetical protein
MTEENNPVKNAQGEPSYHYEKNVRHQTNPSSITPPTHYPNSKLATNGFRVSHVNKTRYQTKNNPNRSSGVADSLGHSPFVISPALPSNERNNKSKMISDELVKETERLYDMIKT